MIGYWALVSARFRTLLQYRAAALAGFGTQLFWGFIRVMIFEAFFLSSTASQPMALEDVITYVWLGQAFLVFLPWNADRELQALIRSGNVTYELLRPLDLYAAWFSRAVALRAAPAILRSVPLLAIAGLFLSLQAPQSLASGLAFIVAMFGALVLSCAMTNVLNISLLWTVSGEGVVVLVPAVMFIFSGMIVPLPFFPDWAQVALRILPFSGLVDSPFRLYMGHMAPSELAFVLTHQLAWAFAFVVLGRWMLARGLRRMTIQGG